LRRGLVLVVIGSLVVLACSDNGPPRATPSSAASSSLARPAYTPVFTKGACNDEVPIDDHIECGTLVVPEDRTKPAGRKVKLPVAIVHAGDGNKAAQPVIYFSGGPGLPGVTEAAGFLRHKQPGNRDVIVFDQRGTGRAEPNLNCPEVEEATATVLSKADAFTDERALLRNALATCRTRLVASGIDLSQYNTTATADDVADLRIAMGVPSWDLFGVSYGTTVALVTMRNHPDGIRSVTLDSVYPTTVDLSAGALDAGYQRAKRQLFDGCAQDAACHAAFPNFEADFATLVARLNADPYHGTIANPTLKRSQPITITGNDIAVGISLALSDTSLIPEVPFFFEQMLAGNTAIVDQLAIQGLDFLNSVAEGQTASVDCADRQAITKADDSQAVLAAHPEESTLLLISPGSCDAWAVASAPAGFNDPVHSEIPTLVLADQYDPQTPPADSKATADALSRATFVLFPGLGHGAVFSDDPCPIQIFQAFLTDPTAAVDTSCVAAMGPPKWTTG
jgi:pimeloyl-ACP methyl ester carboxylesterase